MTHRSEAQLIKAHNAIGVIDSGVGGLTVVEELSRRLPHESIIYFGDTAHMPYGSRSYEEVRAFVLEIIAFLRRQEIKMVVIACNSASAAGLSHFQKNCDLPVLGVIEPGVRAALKNSSSGRIGVIGTVGTISSSEYVKALKSNNGDLHIVTRACPLFVLLVENDLVDTPEALRVAHEYLDPLVKEKIESLILGCTHYPLMADLIQEVVGPEVILINSGKEIAVEVEDIITSQNLKNPLNSEKPRHRFFVSGSPASFEEVGSKLLGYSIKAYQVSL